MPLDVAALRSHFPALADGAAHFDGPGGSQVPDVVGAAVAEALTSAIANRGRLTRAARRADDIVLGARAAMADLLGAHPEGIVFGRSMTQLTFDFSRALAKTWQEGDEIILTRLEHDANIRPWLLAAGRAGVTVRWANFDPATGDLPADAVTSLLSPRTRLVAVTGASNLLGTRPAVADIAHEAHRAGVWVYVDGVHLTPHAPIDVDAIGADLYVCSAYKFLGPHCGVLAGRPALLDELHPDKLEASPEVIPERFELGTLPYELLAGTTAAVDFLASLGSDGRTARPGLSRRERLVEAMTAIEHHEDGLRRSIEVRLGALDRITLHGRAPHRTPTVLFTVAGLPAVDVSTHLAGRDVNAPAGSFYALQASRRIGLGDEGGVRVGLAPYNHGEDADRLIAGVAELVGEG